MSRKKTLFWAVSVLIVCASLASSADPPEDKWSEPVNGLRITVRPVKREFGPDETPAFYVILRNDVEKDIQLAFDPVSGAFTVTLTDEADTARRLTTGRPYPSAMVSAKVFVPLPRGTTYPFEVSLDRCYDARTGQPLGKLPAGRYALSVAYADAGLTSPPVRFTVAKAPDFKTDGLINLARLATTHVNASAPNGNRGQDDPYYGVLNMFDGGEHYLNNINYTWWTSSGPWGNVYVGFEEHPAEVHAIVVETTDQYVPKQFFVRIGTTDKKQALSMFNDLPITPGANRRTTFVLPKPLERVNFIRLEFKGDQVVSVAEIEVYGRPPKGVETTPGKPLIGRQPFDAVHAIDVFRSGDAHVIALAEAALPDPAEVTRTRAPVISVQLMDTSVPEEKTWWYYSVVGVKIPYAITADAVAYYRSLILGYREHRPEPDSLPPNGFAYRPDAVSSALGHRADASFHKLYRTDGRVFEDVHVVTLSLSFRNMDVAFSKTRLVILDREGKVLFIRGDGRTPVTVN